MDAIHLNTVNHFILFTGINKTGFVDIIKIGTGKFLYLSFDICLKDYFLLTEIVI